MTTEMQTRPEERHFEFGQNWARFLALLNDERIELAKRSLRQWTGLQDLSGRTFLDVGSGSGLFSLAARMLGAKVHSFDYDPDSVACTAELRRRYCADDPLWQVERASVLDAAYVAALGQFDIVYSWGVLHHTGDMRRALANVVGCVRKNGLLYLSIYNDQGWRSRVWLRIKQLYNRLPSWLRMPYVFGVMLPINCGVFLLGVLRGRPGQFLHRVKHYPQTSRRGMSWWHDQIDWVGGYPFEVATPEEIFSFYHERGFNLVRLRTCGGALGCNEFLLRRISLYARPLDAVNKPQAIAEKRRALIG